VLQCCDELVHSGGGARADAGSEHSQAGDKGCGFGEVVGDRLEGGSGGDADATGMSAVGVDQHPACAEPVYVADESAGGGVEVGSELA